jgi:hypothetical protein
MGCEDSEEGIKFMREYSSGTHSIELLFNVEELLFGVEVHKLN